MRPLRDIAIACANSIIDIAANLAAEVGDRSIQNLERYRADSPLFAYTLASHDSVLEAIGEPVPDGTSSPAVADGVYLLLAPLSAGEHTIHFHGEFPDFNFVLDITYDLIVAP